MPEEAEEEEEEEEEEEKEDEKKRRRRCREKEVGFYVRIGDTFLLKDDGEFFLSRYSARKA